MLPHRETLAHVSRTGSVRTLRCAALRCAACPSLSLFPPYSFHVFWMRNRVIEINKYSSQRWTRSENLDGGGYPLYEHDTN